MITNETKNALAKANGLEAERRVEIIREGVRKEFPSVADEVAILRKAVAYLFEIISILHEGELDNAEFAEYNALVEQIKTVAKATMEET